MNCEMSYPYLLRQSTSAPVSHTLCWRQSCSHNLGYSFLTNGTGTTRFGLVLQPFYAVFSISLSPKTDCLYRAYPLSEMALLFRPSATANMMSALRTKLCGVVGLIFHLSNVSLSSWDISILRAIPAMLLLSHDKKVRSTYIRD